jgi:hypothetical protein
MLHVTQNRGGTLAPAESRTRAFRRAARLSGMLGTTSLTILDKSETDQYGEVRELGSEG